MDLFKAYDFIPHGLLIEKLAAYGVDYFNLYTIICRKQRVRINSELCSFADDNTLYAVGPFIEYIKSLLSDVCQKCPLLV